MERIKHLLKTKQAKIVLAVLCVIAVLTAAFLLQPSSNASKPDGNNTGKQVADNSPAASLENNNSDSDLPDAPSQADDSAGEEKTGDSNTSPSSSDTKTENPSDTRTENPPESGKDKYQTDPVPEGKPAPVEPEELPVNEDKKLTCTLSIRCDTILNNMDKLSEEKKAIVPGNGVILETVTVTFSEGESVFDVLKRVTRQQRIHMEFAMTPIYNSAYIEGISNLYEMDCGALSGWMYKVNDWFPNYGCSRYQLKQGDAIEFVYTCDLGRDVGGDYAAGQGGAE